MAVMLERHKLMYVGPTKTGSTTITHWLIQLGARKGMRQAGVRHRVPDGGVPEGWVLAVSVRNPYTRVPSAWAALRRKRKTGLGFERWLREEYGRKRNWKSGFSANYTTMAEHLRPVIDAVRFVVRLESLEADLRGLADEMGIGWREPSQWRRNATREEFRKVGLSGAEAALIRDKSMEDFERFGYSLEPVNERVRDNGEPTCVLGCYKPVGPSVDDLFHEGEGFERSDDGTARRIRSPVGG